MKRTIAFILCFLFIIGAIPAKADDEPAAPKPTRLCGSASMADHRDIFAPIESGGFNAPLTRARAAQVLYSIDSTAGSRPTAISLTDVSPDSDYAAAAAWAAENGIFPVDNGSFLPDRALNRGELAEALCAYLDCADMVLPEINTEAAFYDTAGMSEKGKRAAGIVQRGGVMIESADGNFYPAAQVTVAEAESVFLRFIWAMRRRFMTLPVATVSETEPVDNKWFEDVCFIGHSQVVAMGMYFDFEKTDYLAEVGFTAPDMLVHKGFHRSNGRYGSLLRLLENNSYGKVYVMLGINDVSDRKNRIEEFKEPMRKILDIVKETQPDAKLYLISLAPVGRSAPYKVIYNPKVTTLYSQAVKDLSREYDAEYIDFFRLLSDSEGYMIEEYCVNDGIHIVPKAYEMIEDYLKRHTL